MKKHAKALLLVCTIFLIPAMPARAATTDNKTAIPPPAPVLQANANRKTAISANEIKLRTSLRNLFLDCLKSQRSLAVKTLTNARDLPQAQAKLTETVNKIGDIFKAYYGSSTGGQITALFGQFIQATADYAASVKKDGDRAGVISGMHGKAEEIAKLFDSFNPAWTKSGLSDALNNYCAMSIKEIDMEHTSLGKPDAKIFGATFKKSAEIAEILATGIAKQFHEQFKKQK